MRRDYVLIYPIQLFARRGVIPQETGEPDPWTTFAMPLREPTPAPTLFDFVRFLASSITFVAHLSDVSVWFDGRQLARIRRERGVPKSIPLRKGLKADSSKGLMKVIGIDVMRAYTAFMLYNEMSLMKMILALKIKAEIMLCVYSTGSTKPKKAVVAKPIPKAAALGVTSGFFSSIFSSFTGTPSRTPTPAIDHTPIVSREEIAAKEIEERKKLQQINETSVSLSIFAADVVVTLDDRLRRELLRATKKNPPGKMRLELIYVCCSSPPFQLLLMCFDRLGRTSMMLAVKKTRRRQKRLEVSSEDSEQILMGMFYGGAQLCLSLNCCLQERICEDIYRK